MPPALAASTPSAVDHDIIIVGAGPTGLTLANLLGLYGLDVLVLERSSSTVQEPRAVSIDDESLRTMQAIGLIEEVWKAIVPGYGSEYFSASGRRFLTVSPTETPYGYPRRNAFRQPVLEAQLRDHLSAFPSVKAVFGQTLKGVTQDERHVAITVEAAKGELGFTCKYLVGADGASSAVRRSIGLSLEGETFNERWLIVDLENSPTASRQTQVFCDARRPSIALPGPDGTRRFEFKLRDDETAESMLEDKVVADLIARKGAHPDSILRRKVVYNFHSRVADHWSKGRVFLAGDACHLTPPFAGQGMNSGIRDAHNLAWKLAAVCLERLGPRLLDSYEAERRPHVSQMIDLAMQVGRIMGPSSPASARLVQTAFHVLSLWPWARDYFGQMRYKPKAYFRAGFLAPATSKISKRTVGRLIPQPRLRTAANAEAALDDLLGSGFALVALTNAPGLLSRATSAAVYQRLGVARFAVCDDPAAAHDACSNVTVLADPSEALRTFAGGASEIAFLVRPDRYVMGVFRLCDAGAFSEALEQVLNRTDKIPTSATSALGRMEALSASNGPPRSEPRPGTKWIKPRESCA